MPLNFFSKKKPPTEVMAIHQQLLKNFSYRENANGGVQIAMQTEKTRSESYNPDKVKPIDKLTLSAIKTYEASNARTALEKLSREVKSAEEYITGATAILNTAQDNVNNARQYEVPAHDERVEESVEEGTSNTSGGWVDYTTHTYTVIREVPAHSASAGNSDKFEKQVSACITALEGSHEELKKEAPEPR